MIISESHDFVFIHNPKCGGTTIREALMPFDTTGNFFWWFTERGGAGKPGPEAPKATIDKAHMPMHVFRAMYPAYFQMLASYFVFAIVRNPYDRAVSAFNETHQALFKAYATEPESYVAALNQFWQLATPDTLKGWNFAHRHCVRQRDMIYLGAKCMADVVIRIEEWDAGIRKVGQFRPELHAALVKSRSVNVKRARAPTLDLLSRDSLACINELYQGDFTLFDYPMV